jgi:hypothetical protein
MKTNIRVLSAALSLAVAALVSSCKEEAQVQPEADGKVTAAAIIPVGTCTDNADGSPTNTLISVNTTWTTGNTYILRGYVRVVSGATLTIQPGVIIKGECEGTLIVERGSKIDARGTANSPIVFTSNKDNCSKAPGDWGGVIILGNAPNNKGTNVAIEGIQFPAGTTFGFHGGTVATDNSGFFQYVRIEYPGGEISDGNEINGLTLGSVGNGTVIDHVQVVYAQDDAFEWFGGTVNASYLYAYGASDDDFDTDLGYVGRVQFAAGVKVSSTEPTLGASNGFESDNDGTGSGDLPQTNPRFANVTLVGPCADPDAAVFGQGLLLRRNTSLDLYSSVVLKWTKGITISSATPTLGSVSVFDGGTLTPNPITGVTASTGNGTYSPCPLACPAAPNLIPTTNTAGTIPAGLGFVSTTYRGAFSAVSSNNTNWNLGGTWLSFPCFGCGTI